MAEYSGLFDSLTVLSSPVQRTCPELMEVIGQTSGFILYSTIVTGPRDSNQLVLKDVHDRALVFVDGQYVGVVERWEKGEPIVFDIPSEGTRIQLLVENRGRINYGPLIKDGERDL